MKKKPITEVDLKKKELIAEILKLGTEKLFDENYYMKFTKEQLIHHIECLKRKIKNV